MAELVKELRVGEKLDWVFDWSELDDDSDTISSFEVTSSGAGITLDASTRDGFKIQVFIIGLLHGQYTIMCTVTTAAGRIKTEPLILSVV